MILWTAVLAASGLREGVLNLRPVSPSLPGLYRSAAYERATAADAEKGRTQLAFTSFVPGATGSRVRYEHTSM